MGSGDDTNEMTFFKKPRLNEMLKKETPTLIELRENAYHDRVKEHGPYYFPAKRAGSVNRKCEMTKKVLASLEKTDDSGNRLQSAAELQDKIEKERAWIRQRNAKIYDNKIAMLAHYSSDGGKILKKEIHESEARL
jgi:hypothetical protein